MLIQKLKHLDVFKIHQIEKFLMQMYQLVIHILYFKILISNLLIKMDALILKIQLKNLI